ncbi:MAG TPA: hypothetical protein VMV94_20830, partial [Phycisphaerae bacterium]|nr:hypothetical protein [Phycisphaerae bacterium]
MSRSQNRVACWFSLLLWLLVPASVHAQKMYFTEWGSIYRANLDGTNILCLISAPTGPIATNPWGIALDVAGGKMYWTDIKLKVLRRANLDGSEIEDLAITCEHGPKGIALDLPRGKVYWTEETWLEPGIQSGCIRRANLDGTEVEQLVNDSEPPAAIALDLDRGKMYWVHGSMISRANLDGSLAECLYYVPAAARTGIALDPTGSNIYCISERVEAHEWSSTTGTSPAFVLPEFTVRVSPRLQRAKTDLRKVTSAQSAFEDLAKLNSPYPTGIALDPQGHKVYWTLRTSGPPSTQCPCEALVQ